MMFFVRDDKQYCTESDGGTGPPQEWKTSGQGGSALKYGWQYKKQSMEDIRYV